MICQAKALYWYWSWESKWTCACWHFTLALLLYGRKLFWGCPSFLIYFLVSNYLGIPQSWKQSRWQYFLKPRPDSPQWCAATFEFSHALWGSAQRQRSTGEGALIPAMVLATAVRKGCGHPFSRGQPKALPLGGQGELPCLKLVGFSLKSVCALVLQSVKTERFVALQERGRGGLIYVCWSTMKRWDKRRCESAKGFCLSIEHNLGLHASIPARGGVQSTGLGMRSRRGLSACCL